MNTDTNATNAGPTSTDRDIRPKFALFRLGQIVATPGALDLLDRTGTNASLLLARHISCDGGELDDADVAENRLAIEKGYRILSSYLINGAKIWVITEADRSVTTLLLPSEY